MVLMPTPDAVLEAVELLARGYAEAGCSCLEGPAVGESRRRRRRRDDRRLFGCPPGMPRPAGPARWSPQRRRPGLSRPTSGLRWSATGIVDAARERRLVTGDEADRLAGAAAAEGGRSGVLPADAAGGAGRPGAGQAGRACSRSRGTPARTEMVLDPGGMELRRHGRDVRQIQTVVLTGGVFRAHGQPRPRSCLNGGLRLRRSPARTGPERGPRRCRLPLHPGRVRAAQSSGRRHWPSRLVLKHLRRVS